MALSVGLMLLELGEDTICKINEYIAEMLAKSTADGAFHNIVIPISAVSTGLTVHCCPDLHERVEPRLRQALRIQKVYSEGKQLVRLGIDTGGFCSLSGGIDWEMESRSCDVVNCAGLDGIIVLAAIVGSLRPALLVSPCYKRGVCCPPEYVQT